MDIFVFAVSTVTEESVMIPRHLLVLINPVAGQGRGESLFIQHVQPLFEMAEIEFTVTVTSELASGYCECVSLWPTVDRLNHAREMMKELDLSTIDGIVISSGDGLVYEVQICQHYWMYWSFFLTIGSEWVDGATRLANSYKDTHWSATHWIGQRASY